MPRVAGVYVNRLKKGIKLQADPTVKYAMQDFGLRPHPLPPPEIRFALQHVCEQGTAALADLHAREERHRRRAELRKARLHLLLRASRVRRLPQLRQTLREHNKNARAYSDELNRRKIK